MRFVLKIVAVLAITFVIYVAVDTAAGLVLDRLNRGEGGPSVNPAYQNEPYASAAFAREAAVEPNGWIQIPGQPLVAPPEYHGKFFNVDVLPPTGIAYRRTTNPAGPKKPVVTVLLLGGSAVYGPAVPDEYTLASVLAARLNVADPAHGYVVYNAGVMAADSLQERDRLSYELRRGLKPDVVVSFDGGMDIVDGVYQAAPGQTGFFLAARSGIKGLIHEYIPLHIYSWVRGWAASRAISQHEKVAPAHLADPGKVDRLTQATAAAFFDNHKRMAEIAHQAGAHYLSVLQPDPYSSTFDHPTPDIAYVHRLTDAQWPGLASIGPKVMGALVKATAALGAQGVDTLDLSGVFKDKTENVYVDVGHLNSVGHRIIAARIADAVIRSVSGSAP